MADFEDRDFGYKNLLKFFADVDGVQIEMGIHEDAGDDVAVIAAAHEFGTETIPRRAFLRTTADANQRQWGDEMQKAIARGVDGAPIMPQLERVGRQMVEDTRATIRAGLSPDLQPETVERKGHDVPLIDTGRLIDSIDAKVKGDE